EPAPTIATSCSSIGEVLPFAASVPKARSLPTHAVETEAGRAARRAHAPHPAGARPAGAGRGPAGGRRALAPARAPRAGHPQSSPARSLLRRLEGDHQARV